jgi:sporulation protein YlmC with PRC-barrel domain
MRKILLTTCAFTMMTGLAVAQSSTQTTQPSATKDQPAANQTTPGMQGGANAPGSSAQSRPDATKSGQSGQAGIRTVDPAGAVRLTFYTVQSADMRASKLMGADVYNLNNENIGEVSDLIIDNGKNIKAVVLSIGGFLGIGDRNVAVQPGSIVLKEQNDGSPRLMVNTTKDELKNAPAFNFADVDKAGSGAATTGSASDTSKSGTGSTSNSSGSQR